MGGGESKIGKIMKQKNSPKSTPLADNTQGSITTKQQSPGQSPLQHPITPADKKLKNL